MKSVFKNILILTLLSFIFGSLSSQCTLKDSTGIDIESRKKIDKKITKLKKSNPVKALYAIAEYYHKQELFKGHLLVSKDGNSILSTSDFSDKPLPNQFHIGGLSRSMTAQLYWNEQKNGKFKFEERISKYMEDYSFQQLTFGQLLDQKTGIYPIYSNPNFLESLKTEEYPFSWVNRTMSKNPPVSQVGEKFALTPANYVLMTDVIQKCSFHSYEDMLYTHINKKLGMNSTVLGDSAVVVNQDGTAQKIYYKNHIGHSGVFSSLNDLEKWGEYYLNLYKNNPEAFSEYFEVTSAYDEKTDFTHCWLKDRGKVSQESQNDIYYLEGSSEERQFLMLIDPIAQLQIILISDGNRFAAYDLTQRLMEVLGE